MNEKQIGDASGAYANRPGYSEPELTNALEAESAITQLSFLRGHIDELSKRVIHFRKSEINNACDINEVRANLTLAYRHLEDSRMRLGKAIQAINPAVICYDKNPQSV